MENKLPKKINPGDLKFAIIATDIVLFTVNEGKLMIRLLPVDIPPYFSNVSGLPGGLIKPVETAEMAAQRLLKEKAKINPQSVHLEQLYTFSEINRDPRGRVVAVAYNGLVSWSSLTVSERESKETIWWADVSTLPKLAYDHKRIIQTATERLKARLSYTTLVARFMPKEFTLTELEQVYELVLQKDIDKRNFRKKILSLGILKELKKEKRGAKHRPAKLYSFISQQVVEMPTV